MSHRKTPVLIVEDEPLILMSTMDAFEEAGFEVIDAYDGEQALERLDERPDIRVIFTDVNMPGPVDGVQLARLAHARCPDMLVIVTSGKMMVSAEALPHGGHFIPKPYRSTQVTGLISSLVG